MSVHGAFCCRPAIAASVAASSSVMVSPGKETIVPELPSSSPENFSNGCGQWNVSDRVITFWLPSTARPEGARVYVVWLLSGCRPVQSLR